MAVVVVIRDETDEFSLRSDAPRHRVFSDAREGCHLQPNEFQSFGDEKELAYHQMVNNRER